MANKKGSDGQVRKTTAQWAADTASYPEGMRLMDTDTGSVRVSKGTTYALAWTSGGSSATEYFAGVTTGNPPTTANEDNGFGGTPVWDTVQDGEYTLTITGAFTADKCTAFVNLTGASDVYSINAYRVDKDTYKVIVFDSTSTLVAPESFDIHIRRRA